MPRIPGTSLANGGLEALRVTNHQNMSRSSSSPSDSPSSSYAYWFYGQFATVVRYTPAKLSKASVPRASCRVQWLQPVKYHGSHTKVSDFEAASFTVMG